MSKTASSELSKFCIKLSKKVWKFEEEKFEKSLDNSLWGQWIVTVQKRYGFSGWKHHVYRRLWHFDSQRSECKDRSSLQIWQNSQKFPRKTFLHFANYSLNQCLILITLCVVSREAWNYKLREGMRSKFSQEWTLPGWRGGMVWPLVNWFGPTWYLKWVKLAFSTSKGCGCAQTCSLSALWVLSEYSLTQWCRTKFRRNKIYHWRFLNR